MIKNNLKMILADREISINKLSELTGLRYATLHAFVKQRVSSINCEVFEKHAMNGFLILILPRWRGLFYHKILKNLLIVFMIGICIHL